MSRERPLGHGESIYSMSRILDPNSLEFYAACGACGLEILMEEPFEPFVIIFADPDPIAYKILDPRAVVLCQTGAGLNYVVGLICNEVKGVRNAYPAHCIREIRRDCSTVKIPSADQGEWFTWSEL